MKRSIVKFFSILGKLLLVLAAVWLCLTAYKKIYNRYHHLAPVGLVQNTPMAYVNDAVLGQALAENGMELITAATGDDLTDAAGLIQQGAGFLVVSLGEDADSESLLSLAKKADITIVFAGHSPEETLLESYDKAWFLGSNAAFGGELMGDALADDFRTGKLPDTNGDALLQYLTYQSLDPDFANELLQATFTECEHYGVYTAEFSADPALNEEESEENLDEIEKELLTQEQEEAYETAVYLPEVLLCVGANDSAAARADAERYGWMDSDQPPYIVCFAESEQTAQEARSAGDNIVVYYDRQTLSRLAAQFAFNAGTGKAIFEYTGYLPDNRSFLIPYVRLE